MVSFLDRKLLGARGYEPGESLGAGWRPGNWNRNIGTHFAGTLVEHRWNLAGTSLHATLPQPCANFASLQSCFTLAGALLSSTSTWKLLEPITGNLLLEPLAGTVLTLAGVFFSLLGFAWELTYENKF